jgi:hypothetical protein
MKNVGICLAMAFLAFGLPLSANASQDCKPLTAALFKQYEKYMAENQKACKTLSPPAGQPEYVWTPIFDDVFTLAHYDPGAPPATLPSAHYIYLKKYKCKGKSDQEYTVTLCLTDLATNAKSAEPLVYTSIMRTNIGVWDARCGPKRKPADAKGIPTAPPPTGAPPTGCYAPGYG